jgi:hypothetical protein
MALARSAAPCSPKAGTSRVLLVPALGHLATTTIEAGAVPLWAKLFANDELILIGGLCFAPLSRISWRQLRCLVGRRLALSIWLPSGDGLVLGRMV